MYFSTKTKAVLSKAGWNPDRQVDITAYLDRLQEEGYAVNPFVEDFLLQFGGLELEQPRYRIKKSDPPSEIGIHFNPIKACDAIYRERVQAYEEIVGESLTVVGEAYCEYVTLMISPTGKVYGAYENYLNVYGNDCSQALESLVLGRRTPKIKWANS